MLMRANSIYNIGNEQIIILVSASNNINSIFVYRLISVSNFTYFHIKEQLIFCFTECSLSLIMLNIS